MSPADKALAALQHIHSGDYEAALHLFAQQTCGRIQEAERSFREALTIAPDNTQAAINLGALLFNKGKIEAAAYWLERGVASIDTTRRMTIRHILADGEAQPNVLPPAQLHVVSRHDVQ
jgi:Tfp pilus assembly protein PilF